MVPDLDFYQRHFQVVFNHIRFPLSRGRRGRSRLEDGFTTTCAISAYHH